MALEDIHHSQLGEGLGEGSHEQIHARRCKDVTDREIPLPQKCLELRGVGRDTTAEAACIMAVPPTMVQYAELSQSTIAGVETCIRIEAAVKGNRLV